MDLKTMTVGSGESWTEEQHASFLNWMEESFVRRMIDRTSADGGPNRCPTTCDGRRQRRRRLDRHIPDTATESTRDFRRARPGGCRKHGAGRSTRSTAAAAAADQGGPETADLAVRSRDMPSKPSPPRYDASGDQVVPQLGGTEMGGE